MRSAIADAVLELEETAEMTSIMKRTVQIVVLIVFSMTNILGLSLCRASKTISVIVRIKQMPTIDIQIGAMLQNVD